MFSRSSLSSTTKTTLPLSVVSPTLIDGSDPFFAFDDIRYDHSVACAIVIIWALLFFLLVTGAFLSNFCWKELRRTILTQNFFALPKKTWKNYLYFEVIISVNSHV